MNAAFVFILMLPVLATCASIDEEITKGVKSLQSFNVFRMNSNYTLEIVSDLDMVLSVDQYKGLYGSNSRTKRKAIDDNIRKWPQGYVLYEILPDIQNCTDIIKRAIQHWQSYTCLRFLETGDAFFGIQFLSADTHRSYIGNIWAKQSLWLNPVGLELMPVIHEIGHAIGFQHEHMRPDRDDYIKVTIPASMQNTIMGDYQKLVSGINTFNVPYDYLSVMHYAGLGVITTLDPAYQNLIGRGSGLSFKDIKLANLFYDCAFTRANCPEKQCPFNGFVFFKTFKGMPKCTCFCESENISDPLVPCSNISKESHIYNLRLKALKSSNLEPACLDIRKNCLNLKVQGLCLTEPTRMLSECSKTCDMCGKDSDLCIDYSTGCLIMQPYCNDSDLTTLMRSMCPKSCQICTEPSTSCDVLQALGELDTDAASFIYQTITLVIFLTLFANLCL